MKPQRALRFTKEQRGEVLRVPSCPWWLTISFALPLMIAIVVTLACNSSINVAQIVDSQPASPASNAAPAETAPTVVNAADHSPLPHIDSKRAFQYTREVTAFGERYIGSENHKKLERYIVEHLKGDQVEDDTFTADTIEGKFPVHNIIAKFPGKKDGIIAILGHYDTNYPLRGSGYVGANDGGSSTAILLEFANQLRSRAAEKRDGYSVWLVWTDGEEAVKSWSATDSLYGTRHLVEKWEKDGTLKKIKALMVMDMIAADDVNILRDDNSTPWLLDLIQKAAESGGYQSHFDGIQTPMEDDHLPFVKRGVPSADVIGMPYGYNDVFHHTPQDTMDKLSAKSLEIVGNTILETVHLLDQR